MPTHQRQGTKATPWAQIRGQFWGIISPQDMAINKVLFFKFFFIIIIFVGFYFFFLFIPPGNKTLTFWNCTKFTQQGEEAFGLVEGGWRAAGTALPRPPPHQCRQGRELGTKQHPRLGRGEAHGCSWGSSCSTNAPSWGGKEGQGQTSDVLSCVAFFFSFLFFFSLCFRSLRTSGRSRLTGSTPGPP